MIVFSNPGTIDPLAITTMGVNAKTSKSAIGIFGTGLKFAIAVLARHGCGVHIISGGVEYTFSARPVKIRDQDFEIVQMTSRHRVVAGRIIPAGETVPEDQTLEGYANTTQDLGFTTALGRNWKLWHAYRELYCNCVTDEGGTVEYTHDDTPFGVAPDHTAVIVTGAEFDQTHEDRHDFILNTERIPFLVVPGVVEVYRSGSHVVFYKGIKVGEIQGGEGARYTYNVLSWMYLSEDREMILHSQFTDAIRAAVMSGLDLDYVKDVIITVNEDGSDRDGIEAKIDFTTDNITDWLFSIVRDAILATKERVSKTLRGAYVRYERSNLISRAIALDDNELRRFENIIESLKRIGFEFDGEIRVVSDLGTNITVDGEDKIILVAIDALNADDTIRYDLIQQMLYQTNGFQKNGASVVKHLVDKLWEMHDALTPVGPARCSDENCPGIEACQLSVCLDSRPLPAPIAQAEPLAFEPTLADVELMAAGPQETIESVYVMTGTWSRNDRIVHREIVEQDRVEKLRALHYIEYTDGTTLSLNVAYVPRADTIGMTVNLGYDKLIRQAVSEKPGMHRVRVADLK